MEATSRKIVPVIVILCVLLTSIGGIIIWSRYERGDPVEISPSTSETWIGTIYIGGAVNAPGYYPFTYQDTIEALTQAAGGITDNYTPNNVTLILDDSKPEQQTQKIDINRAEKWLLEVLPGIGEIIAQRIIDYRTNHGKFTNTLGLLEVDGIGTSIYERIKEYITVSD
ncbi:MAG: ComEA family DNA-binding protein [Dehalococcoidales bacterium]|nr:ComEA family DNA-binding protein [Dehalococcoidales bacterium]